MAELDELTILVSFWVLNQIDYQTCERFAGSHYERMANAGALYSDRFHEALWTYTPLFLWFHRLDYHLISYFVRFPSAVEDVLFSKTIRPHPSRNDDCTICLESLSSSQDLLMHLTCKNSWHKDCIDTWLKARRLEDAKCPQCRGAAIFSSLKADPRPFRDTRTTFYPVPTRVLVDSYRLIPVALIPLVVTLYWIAPSSGVISGLMLWEWNRNVVATGILQAVYDEITDAHPHSDVTTLWGALWGNMLLFDELILMLGLIAWSISTQNISSSLWWIGIILQSKFEGVMLACLAMEEAGAMQDSW